MVCCLLENPTAFRNLLEVLKVETPIFKGNLLDGSISQTIEGCIIKTYQTKNM